MCLATVYKEPDNTVICKNVSRIDVDGEYVTIRDIMGDETRVQGRILMVDLANSVVKLHAEVCSHEIIRNDEGKTTSFLRAFPTENREGDGKSSGNH